MLRPMRSLKNIIADAVIEERHEDRMVITQHPVEEGSTISDHAYRLPAELTLTYVWSMASKQNSDGEGLTFLKDLYTQIRQLAIDREPFKIVTGKRNYDNMLINFMAVNTDKTSENILEIRIGCQEILMAQTQVVTIADPTTQLQPDKTSPDVNQGDVSLQPGTNFNSGSQ